MAILFSLLNAAPADETPKKGDLAKLQGIWAGKTGPEDSFQTTLTIKGESCSFENVTESGDKIGGTSKITIDELAKPHKTMDNTIVSRLGGDGGGPKHVFGIYEFIDDNTVRICTGFDKRPTDFRGSGSGGFMAFTLKREPKNKQNKSKK